MYQDLILYLVIDVEFMKTLLLMEATLKAENEVYTVYVDIFLLRDVVYINFTNHVSL